MSEQSFAAGLVGIVLDERYRLDALLGEGGMGAVFRAHHLAMDRKVAVKLLKPHLTSDDAALQRFAREARSTMKVDSEHAVKVLDFGVTPQRDYYMVLEYLDGRTVQRELEIDGAFAPARAVHIAKQALRALGAAHARGLVHRDIKPDNILLMRQGADPDFTKVLDFGVAKLMDGAASSAKSALAITQAGMVFGTPEFMSPEQACGQPLDPRSDLYSLAATMFAMLTGCGMFKASSPIEWLTNHARTPPPHLVDGARELAEYTALDAVLQKCLAKRRDDRPRDAEAMVRLLEAVEPTLGGAPANEPAAAATAHGQKLVASPSTFTPALAIEAAPSATSPAASPFARTVPATSGMMPPTTTGVSPAVRSRRGLWLALGALAIAGMIVTAIVVARNKRGPAGGAIAKETEPSRTDASVPREAPTDAPTVAMAIDAGIRPDAGVIASGAPDPPRGQPAPRRGRGCPALGESPPPDRQGRCCTPGRPAQRQSEAPARRGIDRRWRSRPRLQVLT